MRRNGLLLGPREQDGVGSLYGGAALSQPAGRQQVPIAEWLLPIEQEKMSIDRQSGRLEGVIHQDDINLASTTQGVQAGSLVP